MRAIALTLLIAVVLVSLCVSQPSGTPSAPDAGSQDTGQADQTQGITGVVTPTPETTIEAISIEGSTEISQKQCELRKIDGKILVIHAPGCAECPYVVDKIEEYERELGKTVEYIDQNTDAHRLSALQITVPNKVYLPAVIIDCKVYTGNMGDRFYKESMQGL